MSKTYWQESADEMALADLIHLKFDVKAFGCNGTARVNSFFCPTSKTGAILSKLLSLYKLEIMYGPSCPKTNRQALKGWGEYLIAISPLLSVSAISVIPPYFLFIEEDYLKEKFDLIFSDLGFTSIPNHSVVLDIEKSEEQLFKNMKSETRRKVRRSLEADLSIKNISSDVQILPWLDIKNRNNTKTFNILKHLATKGADNYEYFVVSYQGEPVAWQGVKWGSDVALLEGNAIVKSSKYNKLYANYALQWFIIQKAMQRGVKWIDWVGAEPYSSDPKMKNIMKFKMSWGGELVSYNSYEITTTIRYYFVPFLRKVKKVFSELLCSRCSRGLL